MNSKDKVTKMILLWACSVLPSTALGLSHIESYCNLMQTQRESSTTSWPAPGFWSRLGFFLNPGSAVGVRVLDDNGNLQNSTEPQDQNGDIPVVIFSPAQTGDRVDPEQERRTLQQLQNGLNDFNKRYLIPLQKTSSTIDCQHQAQQLGLTDEQMEESEKNLQKFISLQDDFIDQQIPGQIRKLKSVYDFVQMLPAESYMDLQEDITKLAPTSNAKKVDVVLILHGASDGSLYDLSGLAIPPSFFEAIAQSPAVRNLVIYACYPNQVVQFYHPTFAQLKAKGIGVYMGFNQGILSGYGPMVSNLFPDFMEKYLGQVPPNEN